MAENKSHILSNILTSNESKQFSAHLKSQKKERQNKLFLELRSVNNLSDNKPSVFDKVYDYKYTIDKDYLLRNDLRKLGKLIEQFISKEIFQKDTKIEYYNFLLERKAFGLFEKEISKTINAIKKTDTNEALPLQKLYLEYLLKFSSRKKETLQKTHRFFIKTISEIPSKNIETKSEFILLLAVFERIKWQHLKSKFSKLSSLYNKNKKTINKKAIYNILKAETYQIFGDERIVKLHKCLKFINNNSDNLKYVDAEISYINSQLGLEYFLQTKYIESKEHFQKAYKNLNILNAGQKMQLIYNYSSLLCASEQYEAVIKLIDKHQSIFQHTHYLANLNLFLLMAYIYINQTDNLRDLLQTSNDSISKDAQLYHRVAECIILYYEKEYLLCLTYLENIYNTSRYNDFLDKAFIEFSKIFQHFISALILLNKDEKLQRLISCLKESNSFIDSYSLGFGSNMLCSVWLNNSIKKELNSNS